jgi:hypothetical protein
MTEKTPRELVAEKAVAEKDQHYYEALGRFVAQFAELEGTMQIVLWHQARVSFEVGRAIFSGVRTDGAMDLIRRMNTAQQASQTIIDEFDYPFTQLNAIRDMRNSIIHYGARETTQGHRVTSKGFFALTANHAKESPVSTDILNDMTADLRKISAHLVSIKFRSQGGALWPRAREALQPLLESSWRYKPPPQQNVRPGAAKSRNSRKRHSQQRPPPKSSSTSAQ